MIHPQPKIPVRIQLPPGTTPCPNCGLHYTTRGRYRTSHCLQLMRYTRPLSLTRDR